MIVARSGLHAIRRTCIKAVGQATNIPTSSNMFNGCIVLIGCLLVPLVTQAQAAEEKHVPEWYKNDNSCPPIIDDSDYIVGYGSGSTWNIARAHAKKEITEALGDILVTSEVNVSERTQSLGKKNKKGYRESATHTLNTTVTASFSGLETLCSSEVTAASAVTNNSNNSKGRRNNKKSSAQKQETQTIYYVAMRHDKADLIGKVARVINTRSGDDCIPSRPKPWVPFDKQLQQRLLQKYLLQKSLLPEHLKAANCVIEWKLTSNEGSNEKNNIQWTFNAPHVSISSPVTLRELKDWFWPTLSTDHLGLGLTKTIYYDDYFSVDVAVDTALQQPENHSPYQLLLIFVDEEGRVNVHPEFNNTQVKFDKWVSEPDGWSLKSDKWKKTIELYANKSPGHHASQSWAFIVAVLYTAEAKWPTTFAVIGENVATDGYRFNELLAAIKGCVKNQQKENGSCYVVAQPYLMQEK